MDLGFEAGAFKKAPANPKKDQQTIQKMHIKYKVMKKFDNFILNRNNGLILVTSVLALLFALTVLMANYNLRIIEVDSFFNSAGKTMNNLVSNIRLPSIKKPQKPNIPEITLPTLSFKLPEISLKLLPFWKKDGEVVSESTYSAQTEEENSVFADKIYFIYDEPKKLIFENLNTVLAIESLGLEPDGTMETPDDWNKAGWYDDSARPGEPGNIIINAHYDTNYGGPAAFWELKNIQTDDTFVVSDRLGRAFTYKVSEIILVDINDPNRLEVLESDETKSTATLITCGGVWLPGRSTYNKRLVVKADLVTDVSDLTITGNEL